MTALRRKVFYLWRRCGELHRPIYRDAWLQLQHCLVTGIMPHNKAPTSERPVLQAILRASTACVRVLRVCAWYVRMRATGVPMVRLNRVCDLRFGCFFARVPAAQKFHFLSFRGRSIFCGLWGLMSVDRCLDCRIRYPGHHRTGCGSFPGWICLSRGYNKINEY